MGATVHPHSLVAAARGPSTGALLRGWASSSIRINPACVAKPTAAVAKEPKRSGSFDGGDPPAKRTRGACGKVEPDSASKVRTCPRPSIDEDRCPLSSQRKGVEALSATKTQAVPEVAAAPTKAPACSMRELLEKARLAKARSAAPAAEAAAVCRRHEIELLRAEARRKMDQVVRTVEFNDPFIDYRDAFK